MPQRNTLRASLLLGVAYASLTFNLPVAWAASPGACEKWFAKVVSSQGVVETRGAQQSVWRAAKLNEVFCHGDAVRTSARSRAALVLANETIVRLDQLTTLTLSSPEDADNFWLDLFNGAAHFISRTPRALKIKTPYVNAAVEGTEFLVRTDSNEGVVTVFEGRVLAENAQGSVPLSNGESAAARAGQAPVARLIARPRDAVRWALYYPPLFDSKAFAGNAEWVEPARRSAAAHLAGNSAEAFAALAAAPNTVADARFFAYRAGLLLSVGRLDEAESDIKRALELAPGNAHAVALQSVVALARNDKSAALELARKATTSDPQSAPAWIALSYAQQAAFDIESARTSVEQALQHDPDNVLILARLSEIWLALGDLPRALSTADRAVALNPDVARTQSVLGFAYLTQIKTAAAKSAFEKAIVLDSADPLPRLGLGLAMIRTGALDAGRREIEIAAALDPNNALIRSYLGKAYSEEKRNGIAATQFDMAKELDPNDPTPWFYDAIRKQTENRPVEALRDLKKSIALNDNRAVYRSRLLLDQDLAARGASLARIYNDLGFEQLALREASKSLSHDPADYSAHRFLADAYSGMRRHEIARASEALQSQLLQPLNLNPVSPQLTETNLTILSGAGPTGAGFNEFTPLFERNRFTLRATGVVGSNGTRGNELIHSGLQGKVSYSLGQFHYETDGFRPNNDLKLDIYNAFVQAAITPNSNLQLELRSRRQQNGDLAMRFDPARFSRALREDRDEETLRLGYRYAPSPNSAIILSAIRRKADSTRQDTQALGPARFPPFAPIISSEDRRERISSSNFEIQGLSRTVNHHSILGLGHYNNEATANPGRQAVSGTRILFTENATAESEQRHSNAYVYSYINLGTAGTATLALSGDRYHAGLFEKNKLNPKLGLSWNVRPGTTARLAAFRAFKRSLAANQTIEPTQIAGFNQFFDDLAGTESTRYGIALDHNISSTLSGGVELSQRKLEIPLLGAGSALSRIEKQDEEAHRAYLYWTPSSTWALGLEYYLEAFKREQNLFVAVDRPLELITHRLPVTVSYFAPSGFFARFTATPLRQSIVQQLAGGRTVADKDRFWIADLALGYRFAKRRGVASLEIKNLLDKEFKFQDLDFQTGLPRTPFIQPERLVLLKLAWSWD